MTKTHTTKALLACAAGMLMALTAPTVYADGGPSGNSPWVRESVEVANLQRFGSGDLINGAAVMVRDIDNDVVDVEVMTADLEADTAYSIWIVVFNYPEFCATPYACGTDDLFHRGGDERVRSSIYWGGGILADAFGYGHTSLRLMPGRTSRELFPAPELTTNAGLKELATAEIHIVIRSHGVAGAAGTVADQIGTATKACPPEMCQNKYFSVHRAISP